MVTRMLVVKQSYANHAAILGPPTCRGMVKISNGRGDFGRLEKHRVCPPSVHNRLAT